jgi:hypothetical protein
VNVAEPWVLVAKFAEAWYTLNTDLSQICRFPPRGSQETSDSLMTHSTSVNPRDSPRVREEKTLQL